MTAEQLEAVFREISEYEKRNFGVRNGADFPAIAQLLGASELFKSHCAAATCIGALLPMLIPRSGVPGEKPSQEIISKFVDESPMRNILADMFYCGYRAGVTHAETTKLEEMAKR